MIDNLFHDATAHGMDGEFIMNLIRGVMRAKKA